MIKSIENDPLVSICCLTYNQAPYLRECLDGMLMQTCDFNFEILIHDDASTDGTTEIILEYQKKYPNIVKPYIQAENIYSKNFRGINYHFNIKRAKGKYIAYCEGDDYWTDSLKLQKQVELLNQDESIGLVHTNTYFLHQAKNSKIVKKITSPFADFKSLIRFNTISTLTVCYRKDIALDYYENVFPKLPEFYFGDYDFWLFTAINYKIEFLQDFTSCYRVLEHSASHSLYLSNVIKFSTDAYNCREWFLNYNKHLTQEEKKELSYLHTKNYSKNMMKHHLLHNSKEEFQRLYKQHGHLLDVKNRLIFAASNFSFSIFGAGYRKIVFSIEKLKLFLKFQQKK